MCEVVVYQLVSKQSVSSQRGKISLSIRFFPQLHLKLQKKKNTQKTKTWNIRSIHCLLKVKSENVCDFFSHQQPILQFSNTSKVSNNLIQFWSSLELPQAPQIKRSIPQDCPYLRLANPRGLPYCWFTSYKFGGFYNSPPPTFW